MLELDGRGFTAWFTGLSGAGKSTLANAVAVALREAGRQVEVLDGDEFRKALGGDLGFSKEDRETNVSRLGYVAALLSRHGVAVLVAAIAPYRAAREAVRRSHDVPFIEVFVDCHLEELKRRDVKGLYAKASRGELDNLTGVSAPYEAPQCPEIHVRTHCEPLPHCVSHILETLRSRGLAR